MYKFNNSNCATRTKYNTYTLSPYKNLSINKYIFSNMLYKKFVEIQITNLRTNSASLYR